MTSFYFTDNFLFGIVLDVVLSHLLIMLIKEVYRELHRLNTFYSDTDEKVFIDLRTIAI